MSVKLLAPVASWLAITGGLSAQHHFHVTSLVSDGAVPALHTDRNLVNAWGIAFNPNGPVWVADNGTGRSTLYDGHGVPQSLVVSVPSVRGSDDPGAPTGIVFSGGSDFVVHDGDLSGPARFLFATENGTISAWAPAVDRTHARIVIGRPRERAIYKGLALAEVGRGGHRLYATDFHNNRIDVFNGEFAPVRLPGGFVDPFLPEGFAPFGIQAIRDRIFVTYAKQDENAEDELHGPGLGFVDAFDVDGGHLTRIASRGHLDAPWGLAWSPDRFGNHGDELLIGNFGDGRILAFAPREHGRHDDGPEDGAEHGRGPGFQFRGVLRGAEGRPIRIDGLWGIAFGNDVADQPSTTLFFAAGPHDESAGLYGRIDAD